jgi:hypothetical protein
LVYIVVALSLLVRLTAALAISRRLRRGSRATGRRTEGIEIHESNRVAAPVVLGITRPIIVLPQDWGGWDQIKLDAVLAHERSHIGRHDAQAQLLSAIHRALLWHSPLSWFLHQRIVRVAEDASDDAAVAVIRNRALYAEVLLDFIRRGVRGSNWLGVSMARYGRPDERINRILDGTALSGGVTRWSVAAILALGSPLAFVVAAADPQNASQAQTATVAASKAAIVGPVKVEVAAQATPTPPTRFQMSTLQKDGAAQRSPEKRPTFEAALVKPVSPNLPGGLRVIPGGPNSFARPDMRTGGEGPGTKDPLVLLAQNSVDPKSCASARIVIPEGEFKMYVLYPTQGTGQIVATIPPCVQVGVAPAPWHQLLISNTTSVRELGLISNSFQPAAPRRSFDLIPNPFAQPATK